MTQSSTKQLVDLSQPSMLISSATRCTMFPYLVRRRRQLAPEGCKINLYSWHDLALARKVIHSWSYLRFSIIGLGSVYCAHGACYGYVISPVNVWSYPKRSST